MKNKKNNIRIQSLNTDKGSQIVGKGINSITLHYELSNLVLTNTDGTTINNGQETTDQIIDKHLTKYSQVFDTLS